MEEESRLPPSYLFTLRLWRVEAENSRAEWRGKLQQVPGGESRYFQSWPAVVNCLCALLPEPGLASPVDGEAAGSYSNSIAP